MRTYGTLSRTPTQWVIEGEPHLLLRLKRVFGRVEKSAHGQIRLKHSPEVARDLEWFSDRYPLQMSADDRAHLTAAADQHRETLLTLEQILGGNYVPEPVAMALPPRPYQAKEAAIVLATGGLLVADDVGVGKTIAGIALLVDERARPAVVVTLSGTMPAQWRDQIRKFAPDLSVFVPKVGTASPLPQFMGRGPDVVVLNYHKLSGWADALGHTVKAVIFDEVQELRHSGSQKYNAAFYLASRAAYRMGLSATPIYNYGGEIFSVINVLKPGALGERDEFEREWCQGVGVGLSRKMRIKDPKAFGSYAREQGLMIRHTRQDVGRELPALQKIPHRIPSDRAALDDVKNSASDLARFILSNVQTERGEKFQAAQELSVMLRQATGVAKAPYVADFVRMLVESGEKVVLFGWHRDVYDIWVKKLADLNPVLFTGSESPTQKAAAKDAFLKRTDDPFTKGGSDLLIMSLRAGAGVDGLQEVCSVVVFGELDWSPGVHEQNIGRVYRDGQKSPVLAYFLAAEDGADPAIAETLGLKREQVEGIRDPHADELLEKLDTSGDHTRRLAELYLRQLGGSDLDLEATA